MNWGNLILCLMRWIRVIITTGEEIRDWFPTWYFRWGSIWTRALFISVIIIIVIVIAIAIIVIIVIVIVVVVILLILLIVFGRSRTLLLVLVWSRRHWWCSFFLLFIRVVISDGVGLFPRLFRVHLCICTWSGRRLSPIYSLWRWRECSSGCIHRRELRLWEGC